MKNKKYNHSKKLALNVLTLSMLFATGQVSALEILENEALRNVNGQDGIQISTTLSEASIDQIYWEDQAGRANTNAKSNILKGTANNLKITKSNVSDQKLGADIQINSGSRGTKSGLDFKASLTPALITLDSFRICDNEATATCSPAIGNLAVQSLSNTDLNLKTVNGLFSKENLSEMALGIKNTNVYIGQTDSRNQLNQLVLSNFNFNFKARGALFIDDVEGLRLQSNTRTGNNDNVAGINSTPNENLGYVDLNRVAHSASKTAGFINTGTYGNGKTGSAGETTNSGVNIELMLNQNVNKNNPYALNTATNSPAGAKGLIRLGASGRIVNSSLQFRGTKGNDSVLGNAKSPSGATSSNSVIGDTGIGFRMKADFTKDNDSMLGLDGQATTLEIGGAGLNSYGFEFSNLTGLRPNTRASFDSGNVFINLADTKSLDLPLNQVFQTSRFGNGSFLTTATDYIHNIHNSVTGNNPYSLITAIRGAEFQAIARHGRFTTSAGTANQNLFANNNVKNEWGLALPFYNLNANLALYGTTVKADQAFYYTLSGSDVIRNTIANSGDTTRLGLSIAMSVQGVDTSNNQKLGNKTTSILVIDGGKVGSGANTTSTDYYMGLRNIDMYLKGAGNMGVENGRVNVSLRDMLIVMSAEVAAGYLPGTTYKTCKINSGATGCASRSRAPDNNFALADDVLFTTKLRIGGDVDFSLIPNSSIADGSNINFIGEVVLTGDTNTIQITDPQNGSTMGLDRLTGKVAFNNSIVVTKDQGKNVGQVGFNTAFTFNPDRNPAGVFRARDINFYPPTTGPGARLGELAITGGRLSSELRVTPRN
jgi:hypothetical protein